MKVPWLSVIMPVYNGAEYLEAALESVVAQHDEQIEVIALDDGSSDDTVDILNAYVHRLRLQIHRLPRSGNWVTSTNIGLSLAGGSYLSILHQDDLWLPGRLARIKPMIEAGTGPDLLLHDAQFIDSRGERVGTWSCPLTPYVNLSSEEVLERLLVQNFIAIPAATFSREAASAVGGLDEGLWYTADWDLWLKLAKHGCSRYFPETLASYRIHQQAQTASRSSGSDDFRQQLELVLDRHLGSFQERVDGPRGARVAKAARFSIEANVALAALSHGERKQLARLAGQSLRLGPSGWRSYFRDSGIDERLGARIRAKFRADR